MPAKRKADRNRQHLIQCEPCGYKLRGSRTQLARGIPTCPLCGERMWPDVNTAALVLPADVVDAHPEAEYHDRIVARANVQSACAQAGPAHVDKGMSDKWLRDHGVDTRPRRWVREDFEQFAATLTLRAENRFKPDPSMPF